MKHIRHILSAAALVLAIAASGNVLAQSTSAAIQGQVDPGATVVIRNPETGFVREVKPKTNGKYQARNLPTGTYLVTTRQADGTETPARTVSLKVGQTVRVQ